MATNTGKVRAIIPTSQVGDYTANEARSVSEINRK
jgi:hypothetical protein